MQHGFTTTTNWLIAYRRLRESFEFRLYYSALHPSLYKTTSDPLSGFDGVYIRDWLR